MEILWSGEWCLLVKYLTVSPPTAFQTEGKLYLILDFLWGGDLFTRLSKEVSELSKSQGDFWSRKEGGAALRGMDV